MKWTPSKLFAYLALLQSAILTIANGNPSIFLSSLPSLAALMANKAVQGDRLHAAGAEHVFEWTVVKLWAFFALAILGYIAAAMPQELLIYPTGLPSLCTVYGIKEYMNTNKAVRAASGGGYENRKPGTQCAAIDSSSSSGDPLAEPCRGAPYPPTDSGQL